MTFNQNHNVVIFKVDDQKNRIAQIKSIVKKNAQTNRGLKSIKKKSGDPKFLNEIKKNINKSQNEELQLSNKKASKKKKKPTEKK